MNGLNSVTLQGAVSAPNPAGLTVTLAGTVNTTAVTDANGNYSVTLNAANLGNVQATAVDGDGAVSNTATAALTCPTPVISNFACVDNAGVVTLSGTVTHPDENGMAILLQGVPPSLQNGVTVTAGSGGNFTYTFTAAANDAGTVEASCADCWSQQSNVATATLTPSPTVTLSVQMNGQNSVTLSGDVTADNPAGLKVTFTGVVSVSTVTDSSGHFSVTLNASRLGEVQATTTDDLGQSSDTATATLTCAAP